MARLYPTNIPEDIPASESHLLELIRNDLDDDYLAIWSAKTVSRDEKGKVVVGEADVLLLHPRKGLLIIEAKGGGIGYDGESRQYRAHDQYGGTHRIDDPYQQASSRMYDILNKIRDKNVCQSPGGHFPNAYGYAVVLPDSKIGKADLPMDTPRDLTLDIDDLTFFRSKIERLYTHWRMDRNCRDLTDDEFKAIRDRVLMPSYQLSYVLSAELSTGHRDIVRLTNAQCEALDMLDETDRALVKGTAGTGKTFLLVEKARRLQMEGKRVLTLCYNVPLSKQLQQMAIDTGIDADVMTFHEFCRQIVETTGGTFEVPSDEEARRLYFRSDLPALAFDAVDGYAPRWDAVLVDEGQDFHSLWWQCVESALKEEDSIFYVFYDPAQQIYNVEQGLPFKQPRIPIKDNCRNTKNICHLLQSTIPGIDFHIRDNAPVGRVPRFICAEDNAFALLKIDSLVDHLTLKESVMPEQIVILSHHSLSHSLLAGRKKVGKCNLTELDNREKDAVAFSSISRFKGLESDVIIVVDVHESQTGTDPMHLYTAFSRAKQLLYIIHDGSYSPPKVEYETDSKSAPTD